MNYYPNFNNPYYSGMNMRNNQYENMYNQQMQQPQNQIFRQSPIGLQGKSVDNIDVVKAMDIPLDGSISYFPLTDGTAIITKQLQMDGTSKTIIYKPIENESVNKETKNDDISKDLSNEIKNLNEGNNLLKNDIIEIKDQIMDLSNNLNELLDEMKSNKGGKK